MAAKKYHVALTVREHQELEQRLRRGNHSARKLTRARILLRAAQGLTDEEIAEEGDTSVPTVERTRRRFVAEHLGALTERPRPGKPQVLPEKAQARLIAAFKGRDFTLRGVSHNHLSVCYLHCSVATTLARSGHGGAGGD